MKALPSFLCLLGCLLSVGCATAAGVGRKAGVRDIRPESASSPDPGKATGAFYQELPYGSEAQFNPLTQILNEGYDMLRMDGSERRIGHRFRHDWEGLKTVIRSVRHPLKTYEFYGWKRALRNEIFPLTFNKKDGGGAWVPNYEFHLIGSGMVSARMTEWFETHGAPFPGALSFLTMTISHLLNEAVENSGGGPEGFYSADAVTDLLLFDPAGFLLFRSASVRRFFSSTLDLTNWPGQATWVAPHHALENTGQQFVIRPRLPGTDRWRLFYGFGVETLLGVSRELAEGYAVSLAAGLDAVDVRIIDEATGTETVDLRPAGGIFLDRNNSLLLSIRHMVGGDVSVYGSDSTLTVNLYPGVISLPGLGRPGLVLHILRAGGFRIGLVSGVGLGLGWQG